nr:uncharacterized protein LOC112000644 [Quercus suber]
MIGRTVEVYVDDMMVKSKQVARHMEDLQEVFGVLRRHKLRLNADKCAFVVGAGKFLGYLITSRGIEVDPDQIEAVRRLKPLSSPKEVQVLTGMLAALNRLISKFEDHCRLFYQLLKKWAGFRWSEECDKAFMDLKDYLAQAPMLTAPEPSEDLFIPRSSVKGQVLADFITEFSPKGNIEIVCQLEVHPWKVFMDGASNCTGADAGVVVITPEGIWLEHSFRLCFKASNNEAEYEAFLAGLRTVSSLGAQEVEVYSDLRLVVNQVQGSFEAQDSQMKAYLGRVKQAMSSFSTIKVFQVARTQNRHADSLSTLASSVAKEIHRLIKVELVSDPSVKVSNGSESAGIEAAAVRTLGPSWMDPNIDVLAEDRLSSDEKEGSKLRRMAPWYWLSEDRTLYRRSYGGLYLLCLHLEKVGELLAELHDGVCGGHVGGRSLAHRAMTQGFWWPQMQKDATEYAEAVNKVIVDGLKKRLVGAKGNWAEELPKVLWAYRTTPRRSTEETPFSLAYGVEAVVPTEVSLCNARIAGFDPVQNDEMMVGCLDKLEEYWEMVTIQLAEYQQKLAWRYNRDVRAREFIAGDLVLKRAVGSMRDTSTGKLA